jgi:lysine 2,3-aminomutase
MQAVPSIKETYISPQEMLDPLNEEHDSPVKNIVHRYPDRVFAVGDAYLRHVLPPLHERARVGEEDRFITRAELDAAVAYIERNPHIRDVLISGGDPLTMGDAALERIIGRLRAIEHVEIIRIGTRVPVVLPIAHNASPAAHAAQVPAGLDQHAF